MTGTWSNGGTISYSTGVIFDTKDGKTPERTPTELLATRAIETKSGWVGQIIMAGEIVYETEPQVDDEERKDPPFKGSQLALQLVNRHVHEAFKRLIVGS